MKPTFTLLTALLLMPFGLHAAEKVTDGAGPCLEIYRGAVDRPMNEPFFDCNIALADTLAVAALARSFADDPTMRAADVQRVVTALGQRIRATGDLNENASNYASLGICFFLELAKLEGWFDDVRRSEHFRNMFTRAARSLALPVATSRPAATQEIELQSTIQTKFHSARVDPKTGAIISLKLGDRELLGGPANVIVAEQPKKKSGFSADHMVDRPERERLADSNQSAPRVTVRAGSEMTVVEAESTFIGGGRLRRTMTFHQDDPRIDSDSSATNRDHAIQNCDCRVRGEAADGVG